MAVAHLHLLWVGGFFACLQLGFVFHIALGSGVLSTSLFLLISSFYSVLSSQLSSMTVANYASAGWGAPEGNWGSLIHWMQLKDTTGKILLHLFRTLGGQCDDCLMDCKGKVVLHCTWTEFIFCKSSHWLSQCFFGWKLGRMWKLFLMLLSRWFCSPRSRWRRRRRRRSKTTVQSCEYYWSWSGTQLD